MFDSNWLQQIIYNERYTVLHQHTITLLHYIGEFSLFILACYYNPSGSLYMCLRVESAIFKQCLVKIKATV